MLKFAVTDELPKRQVIRLQLRNIREAHLALWNAVVLTQSTILCKYILMLHKMKINMVTN